MKITLPSTPVRTSRLSLRPFKACDFDQYAAYHFLPSVYRYLYATPPVGNVLTDQFSVVLTAPFDAEGDVFRLAVTRRDDGVVLGEVLLKPHRSYRTEIDRLQAAGVTLRGMAHITGGGFIENMPRILPDHLAAQIETSSWSLPPLFARLVEWSGVAQEEAYRVWNMGVGMVLVIPAAELDAVTQVLPEAMPIGRVVPRSTGNAGVELV